MAILRDTTTGSAVHQGDAITLAYLARDLGDAVFWDDVPKNFDPAAAIEQHETQLAADRELAAQAKGDARESMAAVVAEREAPAADAAAQLADVEERLDEARQLHDRLHG